MALDDERRLQALADYRVLDSVEEQAFDNITQLTAKIFRTPISLVTLIDQDRQWFKSHFGLLQREFPRTSAFCDHAIRADTTLVVPDATHDERFERNPLVTGDPFIRFYCGVPLRTPEGCCLGALCLIDRVPRTMSPAELALLQALGRQVEIELELRRRLLFLEDAINDQQHQQRSKELLASMIVHDLRGPLTAITMLVSLIEPASEPSREALANLLTEAERMRRMLTDFLDVCMHQAGALRLRRTPFVIQALAEQAVRRMERLAHQRQQSVVLDMPDTPIVVTGDPGLLERVLENLIGNAIHHGPANRPIAVAIRQVAGPCLRVEVRDQGALIPGELRESIFQVFERLELAIDSSHRGHGLGLAFCRLAIEAHGGSIAVIPNSDLGNCFCFEIPLELGR